MKNLKTNDIYSLVGEKVNIGGTGVAQRIIPGNLLYFKKFSNKMALATLNGHSVYFDSTGVYYKLDPNNQVLPIGKYQDLLEYISNPSSIKKSAPKLQHWDTTKLKR